MRASATALALAFALAGCGGSTVAQTSSGGDRGRVLFVQQCGSCHKLSDAGTPGIVGKDLDGVRPSYGDVLTAIVDGPGTMPEALVTGRDARAVAAYVARVAGR